jgi:hypothetical protein
MHWSDVMNCGGSWACGRERNVSSGSSGKRCSVAGMTVTTGCVASTAFFSCSRSICVGPGETNADGGGVRHVSSTLNTSGSPGYPWMLSSEANVVASFAEAWQRRQYKPKPALGYCVPPNVIGLLVAVLV